MDPGVSRAAGKAVELCCAVLPRWGKVASCWGIGETRGQQPHRSDGADFYASTGVTLEDVTIEKGKYSLRIQPVEVVSYKTKFIGTRTETPDNPSEVLATVSGLEAS